MAERAGVSYGRKPRADGRWQGYVVLSRGRRRTVIRPTEAEMRAEVDRLADQRDAGREPSTGDPQLGAFLDWWVQRRRDGEIGRRPLAPSSVVRYEQLIRLQIAPTIGTIRLSRLGAGHLDTLMDELKRRRESGNTRQQVYRLLHVALTYAERRGMVARNPCHYLDAPPRDAPRARELAIEDVAAVLAVAEGHPMAALLWLGVATGARIGELLALAWTDVDLDASRLTIRRKVQHLSGIGAHVAEPKTAAGIRTMTLPAVAVAVLRTHRARQTADGRPNPLGLVFPSARGTYLNEANWRRDVWRPWKEAAKIDPATPFRQVTRKAHASLLVALGTDPETLRHRSGHTSAATTMQWYVQTIRDADEQAARKLDKALRKLASPPPKQSSKGRTG